jgi:hypothetical protein
MIGLDRIIGVPLHDMARRGQQLIDHSWIGRRLIGADLTWAWAVLQQGYRQSRVGMTFT